MEQTETLEIVTVEKASEKELVKVNPLKVELTELKKKYSEADTKEFTEKDHYLMWKDAVADFRTHKTKTEKKRKEHKFFFLEMGKIIDKNYNDVIEDAEAQQEAFNKKVKEYEAEKDRVAKEKKEAKDRLRLERESKITAFNALFSDNHFILGDIRVEKTMVATMSDELFVEVLNGFKEAHDKIEAEAREQERLKQEAAEKLRQEQIELQKQQAEFARQQAELKEQQESLRKQQEEIEKRDRIRQEEVERALRWEKAEAERKEFERILEEKERIKNKRIPQLLDVYERPIDLYRHGNTEECVITIDRLVELSDDAFIEFATAHNSKVENDRIEAEKKRQYEEEFKRQEAEIADRKRTRWAALSLIDHDNPEIEPFIGDWSNEDWEKLYSSAKEAFDAKKHSEWLENERVKKIQEEERKREELAAMTDGELWRALMDDVQKFASGLPPFKTKRYRKMKAIALEKLSEIQLLKAREISSN